MYNWLNLLSRNGGRLDKGEARDWDHYQKGRKGEESFARWLAEINLPADWRIVEDLWICQEDAYSQIDTLLVTPGQIYLLNIKNYSKSRHFTSLGSESSEGRLLAKVMASLNRSVALLGDLLIRADIHLPVQGLLVFVNEGSEMTGLKELGIEAIHHFDWPQWVHDQAKRPYHTVYNVDQVLASVEELRVARPKYACPPELTHAECCQRNPRPSICPLCGQSDLLRQSQRMITCPTCAYHETSMACARRLVQEYLYLRQTSNFQWVQVEEYLRGFFSRDYLRRALRDQVGHRGSTKGTTYWLLD